MTKFKTQNHLYHSKALEKLYRGRLSDFIRFLNLTRENPFRRPKKRQFFTLFFFFDVKNHKKVQFWRLRIEFSRVRLRNRLCSLKSPLYSFSRAVEWYKWFLVLNFVIFRQFFGVESSAWETGKTVLWRHKVVIKFDTASNFNLHTTEYFCAKNRGLFTKWTISFLTRLLHRLFWRRLMFFICLTCILRTKPNFSDMMRLALNYSAYFFHLRAGIISYRNISQLVNYIKSCCTRNISITTTYLLLKILKLSIKTLSSVQKRVSQGWRSEKRSLVKSLRWRIYALKSVICWRIFLADKR